MASPKEDLLTLLRPHYIINIILALSFLALKFTPICCNYVFVGHPQPCELSDSEGKLLFFAVIIIWLKTKKSGARSMIPYLSNVITYMKMVNVILWFWSDPRYGIIYSVLSIVTFLWFPEPVTNVDDNLVYFSPEELDEAVNDEKHKTFLICFFALWFPSSVTFGSIFAKLANRYALDNLVFGKVDVTRHPKAAEKYGISTSTFSKQLPTLVLLQNGKIVKQRPGWDDKLRVINFNFTEENVIAAFDLNNIHLKCKEELPKYQKAEAKKNK